VVRDLQIEKQGSAGELISWLESTTRWIDQASGDRVFQVFGQSASAGNAQHIWTSQQLRLRELAPFFCYLLTADARLQAANPPANIALLTQSPHHPIHYLQRDDALEAKISQQFRNAFGADLVVHRNAGSQVPLLVGEKPKLKPGQDRLSFDYVVELEKLTPIESQGDGMRSFAGVLLYTVVGHQTVLLVDEPEAFLHPPQARLLGQVIVFDKQLDRQLFVATHSGDVLRGILNSNSPNVRVVRLRRAGEVNVARELNNARITQVWNDPLLRYSNILDGLFHEKVVICESDADCRFYAAVMDALFETNEKEPRRPDIMFTHCGGKTRLALVVRSLRELEVPIAVVADFDVLREEHPLRDIVEAAAGDWNLVAEDWKELKTAIDGKKPELNTDEIKKDVIKILEDIHVPAFPADATRKIQSIFRRSSPWSTAKSLGVPFVPRGQPSQACERLLNALGVLGIFIVPVGELEGFSKTAGGHGPAWVNEVIRKNLKNDPELEQARAFVRSFVC
jgi:hypothetical protein